MKSDAGHDFVFHRFFLGTKMASVFFICCGSDAAAAAPTGLYRDASVRTWRRLCKPAVHTSWLMYYGRWLAGRKHRLIMRRLRGCRQVVHMH